MATSYFLHAADLHLGSPLKSLGSRISAGKAQHIRAEVKRVFEDLVNIAIDRKVEFVVLAGDVYDQAENDPGAQLRVNNGFRRLKDAGIKVFMVHGNHDPLKAQQRANVRDLPDNVVVFESGQPQTHLVSMSNGVNVTVAGVSFGTATESENLAARFASLSGHPLVAVLHANVGGSKDHDNYAPCTVADLMSTEVNYWALGHIHDRSINGSQNKWWVYPGNLQGRSTKATECGEKGVVIVPVSDAGQILQPEFVACDRARFLRLDIPVNGALNLDQVQQAVVAAVEEEVDKADGRPLVIRAELTGATVVHRDIDTSELLDIVIEQTSDAMGFGQVVKLVNSTRPLVNIDEVRQSNTIVGEVLSSLNELSRSSQSALPAPDSLPKDTRQVLEDPEVRAALLVQAEQLLVDELWGAQ